MIVIANVFLKLHTVEILVRPLTKKRRFRTRFESQHVKASQILAKSPWERFYHVFPLFSGKLIWKMCPLVSREMLGLSLNTLTYDGKDPIQGRENLQLQFKCNYLENEKTFLNFLFHFWILHQIFKTLEEKMIIIANVFPKLQNVKIFVRKLSKEQRFRTGFCSQHVKSSQMFAKFPWECFYHIFLTFSTKLIGKMSPLLLGVLK